MFDKEYAFKGTHGDKVIKLTAKFDDKNAVFNRNLDVYMMAPIVGFLYQRKSETNNEGDKNTKIFPDILIKNKDDLWFNYRLIILLDKKHEPNLEKRIDKAFRIYDTEEAKDDEKLFDSYVLGGVDILYEKIMEGASSAEEYMSNLYDFMEEMDERYNQTVDSEHIEELCKLAKQ